VKLWPLLSNNHNRHTLKSRSKSMQGGGHEHPATKRSRVYTGTAEVEEAEGGEARTEESQGQVSLFVLRQQCVSLPRLDELQYMYHIHAHYRKADWLNKYIIYTCIAEERQASSARHEHCLHQVVTLLLPCDYTVVTLLSHCCYTIVVAHPWTPGRNDIHSNTLMSSVAH
jgi:hypothetical protein